MEGIVLEGVVTSGLGKGAIFMSIDYYKEKIKEKLGFDPYPGTLNLRVDKEQTSLLKGITPIRIESFKKNDKNFGGASCYKARISNINGSIIVPDLTENEEDVVEVIAAINLKSKLGIKDGDKLKIQLENSQ